jgi:hypothetical protein
LDSIALSNLSNGFTETTAFVTPHTLADHALIVVAESLIACLGPKPESHTMLASKVLSAVARLVAAVVPGRHSRGRSECARSV